MEMRAGRALPRPFEADGGASERSPADEIASSRATRRLRSAERNRSTGLLDSGPILGLTLAHDPRRGAALHEAHLRAAGGVHAAFSIARVHPHSLSDGIAWHVTMKRASARGTRARERCIFQRASSASIIGRGRLSAGAFRFISRP